ncbi:hypothetical protein OIV83_002396 [Microbotryomycetes sp. JL201]|nr:hypothetical protein OIV83_002396 [Microbotryomycetes sp. JL201]
MGQQSSSFQTTATEDETMFREDTLSQFAAIAFLSNSQALGDTAPQVLDNQGVDALNAWLGKGGALIGLHAGCACLFQTPSFGVAMGSWFNYHPTISNVTFLKADPHVSTEMLPDRYTVFEETYNFLTDPRDVDATVILTPDPESYSDPEFATRGRYQGSPHPSAWYRDSTVNLGNGTDASTGTMTGRLWFTSLGHTIETWQSETHLAHVRAGIEWALQGTNNQMLQTSTPGSASRTASMSFSRSASASSSSSRDNSRSSLSSTQSPSSNSAGAPVQTDRPSTAASNAIVTLTIVLSAVLVAILL